MHAPIAQLARTHIPFVTGLPAFAQMVEVHTILSTLLVKLAVYTAPLAAKATMRPSA